jgi:nitrite reductase/ring-hydroxylating ferredoxin subunit
MPFVALELLENLTEGYSRTFKIGGQKLLLLHSGGATRLIPQACPHAGYPLQKGVLVNGAIHCRKHGIAFCLNSGKALGGEAVSEVPPLAFTALTEQNGQIGVWVD